MVKESQIEGGTHQHDSDIHYQSFPELIPEDQSIDTDDDCDHHHHKKHGKHWLRHHDL
jgi:hypothetical protein